LESASASARLERRAFLGASVKRRVAGNAVLSAVCRDGILASARHPTQLSSDVRLAARNACFGLIMGDIFAAPNVEQGLLFYVLAGIAVPT